MILYKKNISEYKMQYEFKNGKIILRGKFYEDAIYNVSNQVLSAIFDGRGCVPYYALGDKNSYYATMKVALHYDGKPTDFCMSKTVEMIGRKQIITIDFNDGNKLIVKSFLDKSTNAVFMKFTLDGKGDKDVDIAFGHALINGVQEGNFVFGRSVAFAANKKIDYVADNYAVYLKFNKDVKEIKCCWTCGDNLRQDINAIHYFDQSEIECENEISQLKIPTGLNEKEKAMFYSCYFCSLENYKEKGDFKGFMAGHSYLLPMRTYYRDSYFTVLPMYNGNSELVRNQILTLAKGISENGDCPSAVKSDYSAFWGNHFDSPSFFAIMLYDYVRITKNVDILEIDVGGMCVLEKAVMVINKLSGFCDHTGLLYKSGRYNKRDWADQVCRYGYVAFDEILFARALYSLSKLFEIKNNDKLFKEYAEKYLKVKIAINEVLWDDKLGYYVNFKNEDYTETNLSIDTVFAALFDISDSERSIKMLKNMEQMLEVKNNKNVSVADYGVMSVYPFYTNVYSGEDRSLQPFHYHNGGNWPYLSAMYALAKRKFGLEYKNALESWFLYNIKKANYTPIEYFSSVWKDGSLLQAWSGVSAFVLDKKLSENFYD